MTSTFVVEGQLDANDIDAVLAERGNRYGEFNRHAILTQGIKEIIREGPSFTDMDDDLVEALDMIAHKIGRIVNGSPTYKDSWTDIAGYAMLIANRLEE